MMNTIESVWVFHGIDARFAGGVFTDVSLAEAWILKHRLTGVLTQYPINAGCYDWAIEEELFAPTKNEHYTSTFVGKFTTAAQEHIHFEEGIRC
ncbi:DUF7710 domain-containing protein [Chitinophaga agri]|nr:hypothetical protein [Chitinophaga agri]